MSKYKLLVVSRRGKHVYTYNIEDPQVDTVTKGLQYALEMEIEEDIHRTDGGEILSISVIKATLL